MKRNLRNMAAILAAAVLAGFGVATVTVGGPAAAAEQGSVTRHYSTPCYAQLRADNPQVPNGADNPQAYLAWWNTADVQARDAYLAQARQCQAQHTAKYGEWNWSSMILVAVSND